MRETQQLAEYVSSLRYEDLPPEVVLTAKKVIRDMVGVGLFASRLPWTEKVTDFAQVAGGRGSCTVWGRELRLTAPFAALANGTAAHGIEMDERIHGQDLHNGSSSVAAGIATAEHVGATGRDLILAIACGYEIASRVSRASNRQARRFYPSSLWNVLGCTTAASLLLGLDAVGLQNALGIAGGMACGLTEYNHDPHGTMVKRLQGGGWPAQSGVTAAMLAQRGFTGPSSIIEGENGMLRSFCTTGEPIMEALTDRLGETWEMPLWETKWFAAWGGSHSGIEAILALRELHGFTPDQIQSIEVGISEKIYPETQRPAPRSILAAQHNLPFILGAALYYDLHDPRVWQDTILDDERVLAIASRVRAHVDTEINDIVLATRDLGGTKMAIMLSDGREVSTYVRYTKGTLNNPLSAEELDEKFRMMSGAALPPKQVDALSDLLTGLDESEAPLDMSVALRQGAAV